MDISGHIYTLARTHMYTHSCRRVGVRHSLSGYCREYKTGYHARIQSLTSVGLFTEIRGLETKLIYNDLGCDAV
jgi:hypothetical protein